MSYLTISKLTSSCKEDTGKELTGNKQKNNVDRNEVETVFEFETKRRCLALGKSKNIQHINMNIYIQQRLFPTVILMKSSKNGRNSHLHA
eukprot:15354208-Ditylum_brightwellii.AAC.1